MGKTASPELNKNIISLFSDVIANENVDIVLSYHEIDYFYKVDAKY